MKKPNKLWIVGNWKMYGSKRLVEEFLRKLSSYSVPVNVEIVMCFPYPFLALANGVCSVGAQDLSHLSHDAVTGGVSAMMLANLKCSLVLIGHSERREYFGENDENILIEKLKRAEDFDLLKIFCVGEKVKADWKSELDEQLKPLLKNKISRLVVAYEPVWAIGGNKESASSSHLEQVIQFIKSQGIKNQIIYGGSVNSHNVKSIVPLVDGILVGTASRNWNEFRGIIEESSSLFGAP